MAILIHPGFHKTGTTYLQECVFTEHQGFAPLMSHQEVHDLIVRPHDLQFDPESAKLLLDAKVAQAEHSSTNVISSEILSGTMFAGSRDSALIATRLSTIVPSAKILFTIRRQDSLLKSVYLQYVKRGGRKSAQEFLDFKPEPGFHWFDCGVLEFDLLVRHYARLFGDDNVLVLPQELLRQDRGKFLAYLFAFCGSDADPSSATFAGTKGKSPPASGIPLMRFANAFRRTPLNPEGPGGLSLLGDSLISAAYRYNFGKTHADRALTGTIDAKISGLYRESNRRLQKFVPVSLEDLGYEIAQGDEHE